MAVPNYTTDLILISTMDGADTLDTFTNMAQGGAPVAGDTDYFIQGVACHTASQKGKTGLQSIAYDNSVAVVVKPGNLVFMWQALLAGNAITSTATGGYQMVLGADVGNWNAWITGGNDSGRNGQLANL